MTTTEPTLSRSDDLGMAEAFGRDPTLERTIRGLVSYFKIKTVCETGTWRGFTAERFGEFVDRVETVEIDRATFEIACNNSQRKNVGKCLGRSIDWLPVWIKRSENPILFYLDAHWREAWPILDEISIIAESGQPCVIVVHDCKVPDTDLGFDTYKGQDLDFEYLKPSLDKLKFPWRHFYNTEAEGHRRGVLFVVPE